MSSMFLLRFSTTRGVKTLLARLRKRVCSGGSRNNIHIESVASIACRAVSETSGELTFRKLLRRLDETRPSLHGGPASSSRAPPHGRRPAPHRGGAPPPP